MIYNRKEQNKMACNLWVAKRMEENMKFLTLVNGTEAEKQVAQNMIQFMIQKRDAILCEEGTATENPLWKEMEANIVQTGFRFSFDLREKLKSMDADTLATIYNFTLRALRKVKGADVDMSNFVFPDFPNSTRNTNESVLSTLRFAGYLASVLEVITGKEMLSCLNLGKYAKHQDRTPLEIDLEELVELKSATMEDFYQTVANTLGSRIGISDIDFSNIIFFLSSPYLDTNKMIPESIPYKETFAKLIKLSLEKNLELNIQFKNFTDFWRAYVALENGDVSLATVSKIGNLKNRERIFLLTKLNEGCINYPEFMLEDMLKNKKTVLLYKNKLHPASYGNRFKACAEMMNKVCSGEAIATDTSLIEKYISESKGLNATFIAIKNPGIAIRRLANILSVDEGNADMILKEVEKVAYKADTTILMNAKCVFLSNKKEKIAIPHGNLKKCVEFVDNKELTSETCKKASEMLQRAIEKRLSEKSELGKVYVDEDLKNYNVPFGITNSSESFHSVARGSKIAVSPKAKVLRAFVYKKIRYGGFVDLSCAFYNKDFDVLEHCSWTHLKDSNCLAMHSGDNQNCQNGLAEFIDIDMEQLEKRAKNKGYRYAIFCVISYNGTPFKDMDRCFFGIMERQGMFTDVVKENQKYNDRPKFWYQYTEEERKEIDFNGEVFEPSTVKYRFDLAGTETVNIPIIYDIENHQFIWSDFPMCQKGNGFCLERGFNNITPFKFLTQMEKPNLYDMFVSNINARGGSLVKDRNQAELVCAVDGDVTPFMMDVITKEWL